ncbi:MAG TPA: AMP-binding protein, partial [Alphaproteobacteria bacterium]
RYGLTAVILSPEGSEEEQKKLIAAAKAKAFFMDEDFTRRLGQAATLSITPGADHKKPGLFGKKGGTACFPQKLYDYEPAASLENIPLDTVAYILFTSGTTSRPKGVEITHGNLLAQMKTFVRHYGYTADSALLNILPLHHTDGLTQGPVVVFTAGCGAFRPLRFAVGKIPQLLDAVYKHRISHFIAVPSMLQLIDSMNGGDDTFKGTEFKFVISTAGYLDPHLWERFEKRFGVMVVNVYGLTETVCEALYCGPTPETRRVGTIGKPVDTECRIVNDEGKEVKDGETGEIWLRGAHIMKGYFEMPEETTEVLTKDGWFKTGDLCKRDKDGFYAIVGRKKNIIIVGGMNIYPDDVANVLRSLPGVLDAAVWGEEDPTWGETVAAAVIGKDGVVLDTAQLGEEFLKHASVNMLPRQIHVVKEFPRGPAGKVVIRDLRAAIAGQVKTEKKQDAGTDLGTAVIATAARSFKCAPESLSLESTAETTKGWNSLAHVEFLLNIEKEFGIRVEPKDILSVRSIGDALRVVTEKKKKAA